MLWEIMFEMLGELFKATGEILRAFGAMIKGIFGAFNNEKDPEKRAKKNAEMILILAVLGLMVAIAFMFPQVRQFVFGKSGPAVYRPGSGDTIEEKPRNPFPMAQYTAPGLFKKMKFTVEESNGGKRVIYYYWYAPKVQKGQKLPVVLVLHGKDGMDQAAMYLRAGSVQKRFPSYLLIPQSPAGKVWDAADKYSGEEFPKAQLTPAVPAELKSLRDAVQLLAEVTVRHAVDESRMYVVGCDDGAGGVYGAAVNFTGVFAAGVAIGGKWSFLDRKTLAKTPLLILHGATDKAVPPDAARNLAMLVNASGGKAAYHEFPGIAHDCDAQSFYSNAVWEWMFGQVRPAPVAASVPVSGPAPAAP